MAKTFKVKLIKSTIGQNEKVRATVRGLGLKKINSVRELLATKDNLGMANKIAHLVKIIEE
ncbi:MAG: 50S ribosomal protein L30 [Alphaproteobacteria bacterium]|jgi:large subunit ribosomal protein L30|nr:50S ribosomal protein L30 [Alphaproteobacteria bacterium]